MTQEIVRAQYEAYPYPNRDPRDESKRLILGSPSFLPEINHYLFGGRRDFSKPFRALVAGGGTGDAVVALAQLLADANCPSEVVYVDLSTASRAIAEARIKARHLRNVRFETMSILDLPQSGFGLFDYIDSCGVLHHLDDPDAGLGALEAVLAPGGGMGIMLYGELGRIGVYHIQDMLHSIDADIPAGPERIALAKRLLNQLPPTNWFRQNRFVVDHMNGDAGLYDLLLHRQDRAYLVPEIADFAAKAGLEIVTFISPALYEPANYLSDARLRQKIEALPYLERAAFAELLAGNMKRHVVYLARPGETKVAVSDDLAAVPVFRDPDDGTNAKGLKPGGSLLTDVDGCHFRFPLPDLAGPLAVRIDGKRTLADIAADMKMDEDRFRKVWLPVFRAFNGLSKLYLAFPP